MAGKRITKPSLTIGGTEFKCMSRSVELVPGDAINFCEDEWTCSVQIDLSYGAGGSWETLRAMALTDQPIVLSPSDAAVSVDNPSATFEAMVPNIPFMSGGERGRRQTFTLDLVSNGDPVFATS